jgi:RNAse (barnase) inhibitor barstar
MKNELNILETIMLFDQKFDQNSRHISAINGMMGEDLSKAVLKHYFESQSYQVNLYENLVPKEGGSSGKWLDAWLEIKNDENQKLFQVEIKNWTAYSKGGRELNIDASWDLVCNESTRRLKEIWKSNTHSFSEKGLEKVFKLMKNPPEGYLNTQAAPLICFWYPISNGADFDDPLSSLSLNHPDIPYNELSIFSVSMYLRLLLRKGVSSIEIELDDVRQRLALMDRMYSR